MEKFPFSSTDANVSLCQSCNENFRLHITTTSFLNNEATYTRSIDRLDWKGSSRINCSTIEVSVTDVQCGVRGVLWSSCRMSDYRRLTCHTHHLALFLDVALRFIDPLLPHAVLLLPVILVLPKLFCTLPRVLLILQIVRWGNYIKLI